MTFKEISDHLLAGKMVGNENIGWMWVDPIDKFIVGAVTDSPSAYHLYEDHLVGYLFCSCNNLEVRDNEFI